MKRNGPFHRGDGRGRKSLARELPGLASHARKLPTRNEAESSAKEEETSAVHDFQATCEWLAVNSASGIAPRNAQRRRVGFAFVFGFAADFAAFASRSLKTMFCPM